MWPQRLHRPRLLQSLMITTQVSLNRLQVYALLDSIVCLEEDDKNLSPEQLEARNQLTPLLEEALDQLDHQEEIKALAKLVLDFTQPTQLDRPTT